MSDTGYNVWGAVAGVIGTAVVIPALIAWFVSLLPSAQLPGLLVTMEKTRVLFTDGIRDGLLTDEDYIYQSHLNLLALRMGVDDLSAQVDEGMSWEQDIKNWYHGLSGRIKSLREKIEVVRVRLARAQSGERKRLAAIGYSDKLAEPTVSREYLLRYAQLAVLQPPPMSAPQPPWVADSHAERDRSYTTRETRPITAMQSPPYPASSVPCVSSVTQYKSTIKAQQPLSTQGESVRYLVSATDVKRALSDVLGTALPHRHKSGRCLRTHRRTLLARRGRELLAFGDTPLQRRATVAEVECVAHCSPPYATTSSAESHALDAVPSDGNRCAGYRHAILDVESQTFEPGTYGSSGDGGWSDEDSEKCIDVDATSPFFGPFAHQT